MYERHQNFEIGTSRYVEDEIATIRSFTDNLNFMYANGCKDGMRSLSRQCFAFLFALLLPICSPAEGIPAEPIVIAVEKTSNPLLCAFLEKTADNIAVTLQDRAVLLKPMTVEALTEPQTLQGVHFAFLSAPIFAAMERFHGFTAVSSAVPKAALDADSASSTTLFTEAKGDVTGSTLQSLKGSTLGVIKDESPTVSLQLREEFRNRNQDIESFFNKTDLFQSTAELISALASGQIQVGATTSLRYSDLPPGYQLAVVEPRLNTELKLPHTTQVYPGWILAALLSTDQRDIDAMSALLKSQVFDDETVLRWLPPGDYRGIHQILSQYDDGFYRSNKNKTFRDLVNRYKHWVILLVLAVGMLIFHAVRSDRLVARRTQELQTAHENERLSQNRYEHLERASIVGQMSSIVAHELRQPLAAISNYSKGIRRRLTNDTLAPDSLAYAVSRIEAESDRANDIISHVQNYASKKPQPPLNFDLSDLLRTICSSYTNSRGVSRIQTEITDSLRLTANPLEVELIIRNLIKNAFEAGRAAGHPEISLCATQNADNQLVICVKDRGLPLADEAFRRLSVPLNTTKPDGLGLGLAIVRKITESLGGHLEFRRRLPQGLAVTVILPPPQENVASC